MEWGNPMVLFNLSWRNRSLAVDASDASIILAGRLSVAFGEVIIEDNFLEKLIRGNKFIYTTCITQDTRTGHNQVWYYGTGE